MHFNRNCNKIFANFAENLAFAKKVREENFWYKKPRYSEVRVITRRVIARYDCISIGLKVKILNVIVLYVLMYFFSPYITRVEWEMCNKHKVK